MIFIYALLSALRDAMPRHYIAIFDDIRRYVQRDVCRAALFASA